MISLLCEKAGRAAPALPTHEQVDGDGLRAIQDAALIRRCGELSA